MSDLRVAKRQIKAKVLELERQFAADCAKMVRLVMIGRVFREASLFHHPSLFLPAPPSCFLLTTAESSPAGEQALLIAALTLPQTLSLSRLRKSQCGDG